jgi:hypothetical protein
MGLFRYLAFGLAVIFVFIRSKMLLTSIDVHIPIGISLGIIASVLPVSVIASLATTPASEQDAAVAEAMNADQIVRDAARKRSHAQHTVDSFPTGRPQGLYSRTTK